MIFIMEINKEDFLNNIWKLRLDNKLEFPIDKPDFDTCNNDFQILKNKSFKDLIKKGEWFSRYEYKYPINNYYIDSDIIGLKSSDYFHFDSRMLCDSINSPSPIRVWNNEKFFKSMASALLSM